MRTTYKKNQQGFGHIITILVAVVVLGAVGFAASRVLGKKKSTTNSSSSSATPAQSSAAAKIVQSDCEKELKDVDICKFFVSWKDTKKYGITSTSTKAGATTKSVIKIDGTNTYMNSGGEQSFELITIGSDTYTKGGDTWWKQSTKPSTAAESTPTVKTDDYKFDAPTTGSTAAQTAYQKQGKEACGSLTCFKYKIVDPSNTTTTDYLWFDDHSYIIRKLRTEQKDNSGVDEQVFTYDNISVSVPSPVKVLTANQYIIPGQSEPMTIPTAADLNQ